MVYRYCFIVILLSTISKSSAVLDCSDAINQLECTTRTDGYYRCAWCDSKKPLTGYGFCVSDSEAKTKAYELLCHQSVTTKESNDGDEVEYSDDNPPEADDQTPTDDKEPPSDDTAPIDDQTPSDDQAPPSDDYAPESDDQNPSDDQNTYVDDAVPTDDQEPFDDSAQLDDQTPSDDQEPPSDDATPTDDQEPLDDSTQLDDQAPSDDQEPPSDDTEQLDDAAPSDDQQPIDDSTKTDDGTASDDKPSTDDNTPTDDKVAPSDDVVPTDFWICLQKKSANDCSSAKCTWCDTKAWFGLCMDGPAAKSASSSDWFSCQNSSYSSWHSNEIPIKYNLRSKVTALDHIEDPYDSSCIAAFLKDQSESSCVAAMDESGQPCEWCNVAGMADVCLTAEQAEMGAPLGISCDDSSTDMITSRDPSDTSCLLAYVQNQTEEGCLAATDADGNECEYCSLQSAFVLCLTQEQAGYAEQMGVTCDTRGKEKVRDPYDTSCLLAFLQDQSKDACLAAQDAEGNACEFCSL
jgi:hypothetical protein